MSFIFLKVIIFFSQHLMMESPSIEEENIIKDVRNRFRLEKRKQETIGTAIKGIRNLLGLAKKTKEIKYRIIRDIRNVFGLKRENNLI